MRLIHAPAGGDVTTTHARAQRDTQRDPDDPDPALHPLIWAWGGVLLTATMWLTSMVALFRSLGSLFD